MTKGFVIVPRIYLAVKTAASLLDGNCMVFNFLLSDKGCVPFLYIIFGHEDEKKGFEPSCYCTSTKSKQSTCHFHFMYMVASTVMIEFFSSCTS